MIPAGFPITGYQTGIHWMTKEKFWTSCCLLRAHLLPKILSLNAEYNLSNGCRAAIIPGRNKKLKQIGNELILCHKIFVEYNVNFRRNWTACINFKIIGSILFYEKIVIGSNILN